MAKKNNSKGNKDKNVVRLIRSVKNPQTGSYSFKEEIIPKDDVNNYVKQK